MQMERLVQMVFYIASHGHVTAKQLADAFQVSTRTVYRDINTLSVAGIPVCSSKGTGGGIYLLDGYTIDHSVLSKEEQKSVCQGLQILQAARYPDAETALDKMRAVFRNIRETKWLEVDFSYWGSDEEEKRKVFDLQYATVHKYQIAFDYFNTECQKTERTAEPLRLVFKSHAWYITAYCCLREEIRTFRLSRMRHVRVLPQQFERELPAEDAFAPECKEESELLVFRLKCSPAIAHRLFDEFKESQVCLGEDGFYYVQAAFALNHWTLHYLLSFGKYVEVLEPEAARTMLRETAAFIAGQYA